MFFWVTPKNDRQVISWEIIPFPLSHAIVVYLLYSEKTRYSTGSLEKPGKKE
jgi:hypothetical protein